jgi:Calcineurin-like phosphoesterase
MTGSQTRTIGLTFILAIALFWTVGISSARAELPVPRVLDLSAEFGDVGPKFSFIVFGDTRSSKEPDPCDKSNPAANTRIGKDYYNSCYRDALLDDIAGKIAQGTQAEFAMFTGDLTYFGGEKEQWEHFEKSFKDIGAPGAGLSPRVFPALGNHELWDSTKELKKNGKNLTYFDQTFPFLQADIEGKPDRLHYYAFYIGKNLFITLCSGGTHSRYGAYDSTAAARLAVGDPDWLCEQDNYKKQMAWMKSVIEEGIEKNGVTNIFVQYHKPSFSRSKHPPLAIDSDPLTELDKLKARRSDLNIFVFNGHNHTTELFKSKANVVVLIAGGGGAGQPAKLQKIESNDEIKVWNKFDEAFKPSELFWEKAGAGNRHYRVNYFVAEVRGENVVLQEYCLDPNGVSPVFIEGVEISAAGELKSKGGNHCNMGSIPPEKSGP